MSVVLVGGGGGGGEMAATALVHVVDMMVGVLVVVL